jgi:hypothetical protein
MSRLVYVKKTYRGNKSRSFQSMCTFENGQLTIFQIQARSGAEIGEVQPKENC